jgi:methylamine dehydrogenase light chain
MNGKEHPYAWLDGLTTRGSRALARASSRRGLLRRIGTLLTGTALLPLLPVERALSAESVNEIGDPQSCDYWRYCALGGTLCACCGGTANQCPPGAELSPIAWIGTCRN